MDDVELARGPFLCEVAAITPVMLQCKSGGGELSSRSAGTEFNCSWCLVHHITNRFRSGMLDAWLMMFGSPCDRKAITDCYMSGADSMSVGRKRKKTR